MQGVSQILMFSISSIFVPFRRIYSHFSLVTSTLCYFSIDIAWKVFKTMWQIAIHQKCITRNINLHCIRIRSKIRGKHAHADTDSPSACSCAASTTKLWSLFIRCPTVASLAIARPIGWPDSSRHSLPSATIGSKFLAALVMLLPLAAAAGLTEFCCWGDLFDFWFLFHSACAYKNSFNFTNFNIFSFSSHRSFLLLMLMLS